MPILRGLFEFLICSAGTVKTVPYIEGELGCGGHTAIWCVVGGAALPPQSPSVTAPPKGEPWVRWAHCDLVCGRWCGFALSVTFGDSSPKGGAFTVGTPQSGAWSVVRIRPLSHLTVTAPPFGGALDGAYSAGWFIFESAASSSQSPNGDSSPLRGSLGRRVLRWLVYN